MSATATLNARVDVADKERFAATASALGISPSAAVNVFVRKFNEVGGGFASEAEACDFADAAARDVI